MSESHSITKEIEEGEHHIKYLLADYVPEEFDIIVVVGVDKEYHKTLVPAAIIPEGKTDLTKSTIPSIIYLETEAPFSIFTENIGEVKAKYKVTIRFSGVDTDKTYNFESEFSGEIEPGKNTMINIPVILPSDAVPTGKMEAIYEISTILEAL